MHLSCVTLVWPTQLTIYQHTVKIHRKMLTHSKTPQEDKKQNQQPEKGIIRGGLNMAKKCVLNHKCSSNFYIQLTHASTYTI